MQAKERMAQGGRGGLEGTQKSAEVGETRQRVAKSAGVSHDTVAKAKVIVEKALDANGNALLGR